MKKFLLCILFGALLLIMSGCADKTQVDSDISTAQGEITTTEDEVTVADTVANFTGAATTHIASLTEDWKLLLVNSHNPVPKGYTVNLKEISEGFSVDKRIFKSLRKMIDDACIDGYKLVIASAYRTKKEQKKIYNSEKDDYIKKGYSEKDAVKLTEGWVAKPGCSEHQTGLAVDINSESKDTSSDAYEWLANNSYKYGFIVRYPTEKSAVTGINYEPWHFRYVGKEHAKRMYSKDLTLEEYIEQIRKSEKS